MKVVLLTADLMLVSSAQGIVNRHGFQLVTAPNDAAALTACADDDARLLAVDLRTPGLDIEKLVADVRQSGPPSIRIMACGPHVHEASLAQATKAGCDEVVTRGQFERRLDAALATLASLAR